MTEEFKTYYEYLKSELDKYRGSFDDYIFYLPDMFKLLCELLLTKIEKEDRIKIACALGYFVAPKDVIQEEIYGPAGYVDDLYLCCYVLKNIKEKYGAKFIEKHWESTMNFEEVFEIAYQESKKVIETENLKSRILEYVGLE
jgi:uncharacterized membrane protein YkvA (DUF1232 family)